MKLITTKSTSIYTILMDSFHLNQAYNIYQCYKCVIYQRPLSHACVVRKHLASPLIARAQASGLIYFHTEFQVSDMYCWEAQCVIYKYFRHLLHGGKFIVHVTFGLVRANPVTNGGTSTLKHEKCGVRNIFDLVTAYLDWK